MSTIQANAILDANGGNTTTINGQRVDSNTFYGKNYAINGAMQVCQRGAAAVNATTSAGVRSVDHYKMDIDGSNGHVWSVEQAVDGPDGVAKHSAKISVVTSGTQPTADTERHQFYHILEAQDVRDFGWGTAAAKPVTISFYVKSSVTGTYTTRTTHYGSSTNQYYVNSYTVDAANTWERKSFTITGPTTGGQDATDNDTGFLFEWSLGTGSDQEGSIALEQWSSSTNVGVIANQIYLPEHAGATWQITGFKIEIGNQATSFQQNSFAEDLARCQRYFYQIEYNSSRRFGIDGLYSSATGAGLNVMFTHPTPMRAGATVTPGSSMTSNTVSFSCDENFIFMFTQGHAAGRVTVEVNSGTTLVDAEL